MVEGKFPIIHVLYGAHPVDRYQTLRPNNSQYDNVAIEPGKGKVILTSLVFLRMTRCLKHMKQGRSHRETKSRSLTEILAIFWL